VVVYWGVQTESPGEKRKRQTVNREKNRKPEERMNPPGKCWSSPPTNAVPGEKRKVERG